jgi:hypothetical protein
MTSTKDFAGTLPREGGAELVAIRSPTYLAGGAVRLGNDSVAAYRHPLRT